VNRVLPALKAREIIRALERAGFFVHHQTGSHAQLKHRSKAGLRITVPRHSGDVPIGTLMTILRQAGLSRDEFLKLL
jgi:predicted RNA binding protein YcfA (HicA-like mRNA interferase family)